jgi:hypothetical protein
VDTPLKTMCVGGSPFKGVRGCGGVVTDSRNGCQNSYHRFNAPKNALDKYLKNNICRHLANGKQKLITQLIAAPTNELLNYLTCRPNL